MEEIKIIFDGESVEITLSENLSYNEMRMTITALSDCLLDLEERDRLYFIETYLSGLLNIIKSFDEATQLELIDSATDVLEDEAVEIIDKEHNKELSAVQ